jgi:hypothetical protein
MEIVWLLGTIIIVGGATFLFLNFFDKPHSKKYKRKHIRTQGSSSAVTDDGGAHIETADSGHPAGEHGCDE